jgi:hypothetical protein
MDLPEMGCGGMDWILDGTATGHKDNSPPPDATVKKPRRHGAQRDNFTSLRYIFRRPLS